MQSVKKCPHYVFGQKEAADAATRMVHVLIFESESGILKIIRQIYEPYQKTFLLNAKSFIALCCKKNNRSVSIMYVTSDKVFL